MSLVPESYGAVSVALSTALLTAVHHKGDVEDRYENSQGYSNEHVPRGDTLSVEWVESVLFCCAFPLHMPKWV